MGTEEKCPHFWNITLTVPSPIQENFQPIAFGCVQSIYNLFAEITPSIQKKLVTYVS